MTASTLGDVALAYVAAQAADLAATDPLVRADRPDAVHRMRVAARRLRSVLATYRAVLDPAAGPALRDDLRWLGSALGSVRDAEVMQRRLLVAVDTLPARLVVGDVVSRIGSTLGERRAVALRCAIADLDGDRYRDLRERLDRLCADPPATADAQRRADAALPELLARCGRRVERAGRRAAATTPGPDQDVALHELRKAAKRARYAAESAVPVVGPGAAKVVRRMTALQDHLGAYQDVVVARTVLHELAEQAQIDGQDSFTYGVLAAGDEAHARRLREQTPALLARAVAAAHAVRR